MDQTAPRLWLSALFAAQDIWIAMIVVVPLFVGGVLMLALSPTVVGAASVAALMTLGARQASRAERWRLRSMLGCIIESPEPRPQPALRWRFVVEGCRDVDGWRSVAYWTAKTIVGPVAGLTVLIAWCGGAALVALPAYAWALPNDATVFGSIRLNEAATVAGGFALGVLLLSIAPAVTRGVVRLAVHMASSLLGPGQTAMLRARLDDAESRRVAAVEASTAERQRIERDLHDGAQLRLSSVAMTLGLARTKLDNDPALSRQLIEQAHHDVKSAMGELRDMVRGIQPAILTEQGLDAALTGLIARCPVPVERPAGLDGTRLTPTFESAAYYLVAEALANIARHADASAASVTLSCDSNVLVVEVSDDGVGGAQIKPLGGIAGLQQRVNSLGGDLDLRSPHGGPTRIRATIPCES